MLDGLSDTIHPLRIRWVDLFGCEDEDFWGVVGVVGFDVFADFVDAVVGGFADDEEFFGVGEGALPLVLTVDGECLDAG